MAEKRRVWFNVCRDVDRAQLLRQSNRMMHSSSPGMCRIGWLSSRAAQLEAA